MSVRAGERVTLSISRIAHGAKGIALLDGQVIFVPHTLPGDVVDVEIHNAKKRFANADLLSIVEPSPMRTAQRCPASAQGAGCCDFGYVQPEAELTLKTQIVEDQLRRLAQLSELPPIESHDLEPHTHWRSRVRLGVDSAGRAGMRRKNSRDIVSEACIQAVPGLISDLVGPSARRFQGGEVVVAKDATGTRHIVEVAATGRGKRREQVQRVLEGSDYVIEQVGEYRFRLPTTGFWQGHIGAVDAYSEQIRTWLRSVDISVAWDLYGGVGAFVPALLDSAPTAQIYSVEASAGSARAGEQTFSKHDTVHFLPTTVENALGQLPQPDVVVLDPPRTGAGAAVISQIAGTQAQRIVHIGCDPATFARDVSTWYECGYRLQELAVYNAFPGTHHMETMGLLVPDHEVGQGLRPLV